MTKLGVIERVTEPTEWVSQITSVAKKNGKVRICLDPRELNKAILRQHYPMKTVLEDAATMPNAKIFSKLDATSGYWQLKLNKKSIKTNMLQHPMGPL